MNDSLTDRKEINSKELKIEVIKFIVEEKMTLLKEP